MCSSPVSRTGRNPQAAHMVCIFSKLVIRNYVRIHQRLQMNTNACQNCRCARQAHRRSSVAWTTCLAMAMRISVVINVGLMVSSNPNARDAIPAAV